MAQRRMFTLKIVDSDAFMDMSQTAQLLYFHLSMRADDDGFIGNSKKIMRMIGSSEDDMKILLVKRFLLPFESGVLVVKHWKMHNYIQNDRYTPTQYIEEKNKLSVKENGSYTELNTDVLQNVSTLDTQVRLGKVRLGKNIHGEFQNVLLSEEEKMKLFATYGSGTSKRLIEELSSYLASSKKQYRSHYATIRNWARRKGIEENRVTTPINEPPVAVSPEEEEKIKKRLKEINSMFPRAYPQ